MRPNFVSSSVFTALTYKVIRASLLLSVTHPSCNLTARIMPVAPLATKVIELQEEPERCAVLSRSAASPKEKLLLCVIGDRDNKPPLANMTLYRRRHSLHSCRVDEEVLSSRAKRGLSEVKRMTWRAGGGVAC